MAGVRAGQHPHLGLAHVSCQPRRLRLVEVPKLPPQAHPPVGGGRGQMRLGRQPRRRRPGTVGLPSAGGVEDRRRPGDRRVQALALTVESHEGLAVGDQGRIDLDQRVDARRTRGNEPAYRFDSPLRTTGLSYRSRYSRSMMQRWAWRR